MSNFYCGHCMSNNTEEIEHFQGEKVKPENFFTYDDKYTGVVVQCKDCGDITGFLVIMSGVVKDE